MRARGDMIECDGYRGRVSSLGYRSTMIETLDGSIIAFQNSQLFNKNFRNMTRNHKFECVKVEVGISYGTDVERARKIILETLATLPFLSKVKKTSVVLDSFGDSAVNLGVWVWVPVMTKSSSLSSVREHIYHAFNEHGISIPFPQQDLYVKRIPRRSPRPRNLNIHYHTTTTMSDDHLTLLGSQSSFFTNPDDARLESFPNRGTRPYTITLDTHGFFLPLPRYRSTGFLSPDDHLRSGGKVRGNQISQILPGLLPQLPGF